MWVANDACDCCARISSRAGSDVGTQSPRCDSWETKKSRIVGHRLLFW
jgi:hypothetical protein